jgi:pilus assembly protein TadC
MSIKLLRGNLETEKSIVRKLLIASSLDDPKAKKAIGSLVTELKLLNNSLPKVLENISFYKSIVSEKERKELFSLKYDSKNYGQKVDVVVNKSDEAKFVKALAKEEEVFKKIKMPDIVPLKNPNQKISDSYSKLSMNFFRNISFNLTRELFFSNIKSDLRKMGSTMILESYISTMLFSTSLALIFSVILFVILLLFKANLLLSIILLFSIPLVCFLSFYFYPSSRVKSLEKEINQELPFLTIYMSAIASSGLEPSKIFSILLISKDYPSTQREIRKLTNYINFYGADLVTSLKYVSKNTPSERLGLLLDGLATTITSGGEITEFLKKHSETLLFDYRLEREKYTRLAETFMNIYISVVIAAPMILMVLLILMSITGFASTSLNSLTLSIVSVFIITLLNLGFLLFLNMKQPKF